ncbi:MAG: hypothetical protein PHQ47_01040 [Candidatus Portnoybacteria bacterium]|nr:hypothetical protein [Candidatus Portnoybacteria bacterium]
MDVIIASGFIVVALASFLVLQRYIVWAARLSQDRLVASNLAQEGFEVVRNIRDNNWEAGADWNSGLGQDEYLVQYDSSSLIPYSHKPLLLGNFYNYVSGTPTKFYRRIIINEVDSDCLDLVSEVTWRVLEKDYSEIIEGRLYNWK